MQTKTNWERRNLLVPFFVGMLLAYGGAIFANIPITILGVLMTGIPGHYLTKEAQDE